MLTKEIKGYQWSLPNSLDLPCDELQMRLDFYGDAIEMFSIDKGVISTRIVQAGDIALALMHNISLDSGILPEGALWWNQSGGGARVALWRPKQIWQVALEVAPFTPPVRFKLPMPGLIFLCSPAQPPAVFAAKRRPKSRKDPIYHAPLFNLYTDGRSCPGSHKYPENIAEIPESFFMSFFTRAATFSNRSKKYPNDLLKLWQELDGQKRYPVEDLIRCGRVEDIMK